MYKENFGRPVDQKTEKIFMNKIRGNKQQAIQSQCELQICLATYNEKKHDQMQEEIYQSTQRIATISVGSLGQNRIPLKQKFESLNQSWVFLQLQKNEQLPQYLFNDGFDLSYILYNIQNQQKRRFSPEELIFLQLLCLEGRKQLSHNAINYYKKNMRYMIVALDLGLKKIINKIQRQKQLKKQIQSLKQQQKQKEKQKQKGNIQEKIIQKQNSQEIQNNKNEELQEDEPSSSHNKSNKKGKTIEKQKSKGKGKAKGKAKSKKGRKKAKKQTSQSQEQEFIEEQIIYPDGRQLALKTVNYITWAYWYVIDKELSFEEQILSLK